MDLGAVELLASCPLLLAFILGDGKRAASAHVPVLVYHRILAPGQEGTPQVPGVSAADFARQIAYLAEAGYTTVLLTELTGRRPERPVGRPVVITFDDGWSSTRTHALPILHRYGMTATAFVTTDPQASVFDPARDVDPPLRPEEWSALAEAGWEIGSHTHTHPPLVECGDDRLREELSRSRAELESATGQPTTFLATPFGLSNTRVEVAAREVGYTGMCPGLAGLSRWGIPPFAVRRVGVGPRADLGAFRRLLTPWGAGAARMCGTAKTLVRRAIGHENSMRLRGAILRTRMRMGGGPCP
ncbi:MAG: polysaccharide deacetylase family protein [Armatimonadetes bacterium]|nr:polysaccharide deacetylase family protein [Armatimonadota bacterium]